MEEFNSFKETDLRRELKITINREPITSQQNEPEEVVNNIKSNSVVIVSAPGDSAAVKLNTGSLSVADRAKLRQEKFGIINETKRTTSGGTASSEPPAKLKQRADRFGSSTATATEGKVTLTTDDEAKLAKRRERFAGQLNDTKPTAGDIKVRKVKRAERFGVSGSTTGMEKKVSRAARFGLNT